MNNDAASAGALAAAGVSLAVTAIICLAIFAFMIVLYWKIASKAGYPGAYSLLMLLPVVNLIIIILFAFTEWPVERAARAAGWTPGVAGGGMAPGGGFAPQAPPGGYLPPGSQPPAPTQWGTPVSSDQPPSPPTA